ncbi:MAG TPA: arsenosugar biosynthesis radical SAM (seleno)protein ArsS [Gammaproteobacteria bacterium]
MLDSKPLLMNSDFPALKRSELHTLQLNLGYTCNQNCKHCHVNAGPTRTEQMSLQTIEQVLDFAREHNIKTLDLTGGAPEMNPHFRYLVSQAHKAGIHILDRCNLTILSEPGYADLAEFLAQHRVEVVASLPCYTEDNVDQQRGKGVFNGSIRGLQQLNDLGYGKTGSGLILNLMYNPLGAFLPPAQATLQADYQQKLKQDFAIEFNQLLTLTNMPIMRFGSMLMSKGEFDDYMQLLKSAHSDSNLPSVMCRSLISIDWQGYVYDCDFNQMLDMPSQLEQKNQTHISELRLETLNRSPIRVADHCYGCTAGAGSSCGGAFN